MNVRVLIIALLPVLAITVVSSAIGGGKNEVSALKQATAAYHDVEAAKDAGYITELEQISTPPYTGGTCIANVDGEGAMGIHLVDTRPSDEGGRIDGTLEPTEPEALLYERRNNGTLKLTGVEYIVAGDTRPSLYGQQFDSTNLGRYGNPDANVWTLHAWIWKPNPAGMFEQWNDRVTC